jgi:hypothetical protein
MSPHLGDIRALSSLPFVPTLFSCLHSLILSCLYLICVSDAV